MSTQTPASHLMHDELAPTHELETDCRAVGRNLKLEQAARAAVTTPPSILFEDYPIEVEKRDITITAATARFANALHLHLD